MVGWVKYGPDCWMIEGDGKCRAEAEARGLPADRKVCIRNHHSYSPHPFKWGERCIAKQMNILNRLQKC